MEELNKEATRKVLVLLIAAMRFTMAPDCQSAETSITEGERFAEEAEKRGYDISTIAGLFDAK